MNIRCEYCNWMNLEVKENFICKNCKKDNSVKNVEEEILELDDKKDIKYNIKRKK